MAITMLICETEAEIALCREAKQSLLKVMVSSVEGLEDLAEFDMVVDMDGARGAVDDWEAFVKRNRLTGELDSIYMERIRDADDLEALTPLAQRRYSGWVSLEDLSDEEHARVMEVASDVDRLTGWDVLSFKEMEEACTNCALSWDKGRGCIGNFGPDNSLLPEIASRRNCPIIASVPDAVASRRYYSVDEAKLLLEESRRLREELPEEGKMMVRRYNGVLERLEQMALACIEGNCRFFFI